MNRYDYVYIIEFSVMVLKLFTNILVGLGYHKFNTSENIHLSIMTIKVCEIENFGYFITYNYCIINKKNMLKQMPEFL